jgi:hypothetical protein
MKSYLNQISSQLGDKETNIAWKQLQSEKWVTHKNGKYFWKKSFGPVNDGFSERDKINESVVNESPDFFIDKSEHVRSFNSEPYITFGYLDGICLVDTQPHPWMYERYTGKIGQKEDFDYPGRLWYNSKIISFWKYPKTSEQIVKVLHDIQKSYVFFNIYKFLQNLNPFVFDTFIKPGYTNLFAFMSEPMRKYDLKLLISNIKKLYLSDDKLLEVLKGIKEINSESKKFNIGDISKYYVDVPAYYRNWDEMYDDYIDIRDFYSKVRDNSATSQVLVPIAKYGK